MSGVRWPLKFAFDLAMRVSPAVLTVLNYHRIDDVSRVGFDTFVPNVTATPPEFARQMDYVRRHYRVISCEQLNAFRRGETDLPTFPLLITFDDGYYDNYSKAYPILKERNLPAVIFLATDHVGKDVPFYWDFVAYCFVHTRKKAAELPLTGYVSWNGIPERNAIVKRWIDSIKHSPAQEREKAVAQLASTLAVDVPSHAFANLYATWDQVREMNRNGIEMGAHTATHPILTLISPSRVEEELCRSKQKIEEELGKPVTSFAYPNGGVKDFSSDIVELVKKTGFDLAFTLVQGTTRFADVKDRPLTIRRIYLGRSDTLPRFVAKLSANRFIQ